MEKLSIFTLFLFIFLTGCQGSKDPNYHPSSQPSVPTNVIESSLLFVKPSGQGPDGTTWAKAYGHPQQAIDAIIAMRKANPALEKERVTIALAKGIYEFIPADGTASKLRGTNGEFAGIDFKEQSNINLMGGFNGLKDSIDDQSGDASTTVLSAKGIPNNRVIYIDFGSEKTKGSNISLNGLTITKGNSDNAGGGLWIGHANNVTLTNIHFEDNSSFNGGGASITFTEGVLENCRFVNNKATEAGGAIDLARDTIITINNSAFGIQINNNVEKGNHAKKGGAIMINDKNKATISSCSFFNNEADGHGGAILNKGSLIIQGTSSTPTVFKGNKVTFTGAGPAIFNFKSQYKTQGEVEFIQNIENITVKNGDSHGVNSNF